MANLTLWTFPHYQTQVEDKSIYEPIFRENLPLHRPVWFMRAESGPVGIPVWCNDINFARKLYGRGTFDKNTIYHSKESIFAKEVFSRQGTFIVRLASSDAKISSLVLEAHVEEKEVPQWERDEYGNFKLDHQGDKVPEKDSGGVDQLKKPGHLITWQVRALEDNETLKGLTVKTLSGVGVGGGDKKVYPIMAIQGLYPGAANNNVGFKFYFDPEMVEAAMVKSIGALTYVFQPVQKTYQQDTVTPLRTIFGNPLIYCSLKDKSIDTRLDKDISFRAAITEQYWDNYNKVSNLPFAAHVYSNFVKDLSAAVGAKEKDANNAADETGWQLNLLSGTNLDNNPLYTVEIGTTAGNPNAVSLNKNYIMYLKGGDDGDISDTSIEALTRQYLMDDVYPDFDDSARYPITHLYDTGVTLNTKKAMIEFLGRRDDVKVILSTQDCSRDRMNTKDEDDSVGASLHAACLLQPESQIMGTEVCRAEIYQQAGYLVDVTITDQYVPFTLDALRKRTRWQSRDFIEGMPKGLPYSEVSMFREWNWTPSKPTHKQRSWDRGLNYAQYYDMSRIHYPDMRSVYRYDTSVLSSAIFTDAVVYTKHIVRYNWAVLSGIEVPFARLQEQATKNVTEDMIQMLNNMYGVEVEFYQTEEEAKIGYIAHGRIKLIGYAPNRVWLVDIQCYRDGYNPEG